MSVKYAPVLWNPQKKKYDVILWAGIVLFLILFSTFQLLLHPQITIETLIIRATALTAFLLLNIILMIGPLTRIDSRFLPLLYNRRHLGVSMFLVALVHGVFSVIQFHTLSNTNPILSLFLSNSNYSDISSFPFQILGFSALTILFLMAATSHDFWLKNLSPKVWKMLHMLVYVAYALIIMHVATGTLQYETHPVFWILLSLGFIVISGLHLYSGFVESSRLKSNHKESNKDSFYYVANISDIPESCAKTVFINGENIAIFKYEGKVSAVNNVCKHQMGPLGEGKIIDGCITCPWHGYQYNPENGQSPPPFTEKVKTYKVRIEKEQVWVNPNPLEEGTYVEPAIIPES